MHCVNNLVLINVKVVIIQLAGATNAIMLVTIQPIFFLDSSLPAAVRRDLGSGVMCFACGNEEL